LHSEGNNNPAAGQPPASGEHHAAQNNPRATPAPANNAPRADQNAAPTLNRNKNSLGNAAPDLQRRDMDRDRGEVSHDNGRVDPRYRWANGHWFYSMPGNRWMTYENNGWVDTDQVPQESGYAPDATGSSYGASGEANGGCASGTGAACGSCGASCGGCAPACGCGYECGCHRHHRHHRHRCC
jgi:hypothetical protein